MAQSDVVRLLSELIRINTSNPPGNEEAAVHYLEAELKNAGIRSEIYPVTPGRANILARLPGKQKGEPVVLLGHLDVVPASDEGWVVPPFSGAVQDGYVYGRGAIDMKSQVICHLLAFVELAREGMVPERDVIFLATADEEVGGKAGVEHMLGKVEDLSDASFVLSEGGCIIDEDGANHAQVSVAEKKICQFMIRATGTGGHASMPIKDNANNKVVRAANRILDHSWPFKSTPIVTKYLNGVLKGARIKNMRFRGLAEALRNKAFREFIENHPMYNAMLRNTVTLTMLKAGEKINVIPTESAVQFDARILPAEDAERFVRQVRKVAGREVEVVPTTGSESIPSSFNTPYFRAIAARVRKMKPHVSALPFLTTGATDLRYFRNMGIIAYGFFPMTLTRDELFRMHGINERISVENLEAALAGTIEIVKSLATYSPPV